MYCQKKKGLILAISCAMLWTNPFYQAHGSERLSAQLQNVFAQKADITLGHQIVSAEELNLNYDQYSEINLMVTDYSGDILWNIADDALPAGLSAQTSAIDNSLFIVGTPQFVGTKCFTLEAFLIDAQMLLTDVICLSANDYADTEFTQNFSNSIDQLRRPPHPPGPPQPPPPPPRPPRPPRPPFPPPPPPDDPHFPPRPPHDGPPRPPRRMVDNSVSQQLQTLSAKPWQKVAVGQLN